MNITNSQISDLLSTQTPSQIRVRDALAQNPKISEDLKEDLKKPSTLDVIETKLAPVRRSQTVKNALNVAIPFLTALPPVQAIVVIAYRVVYGEMPAAFTGVVKIVAVAATLVLFAFAATMVYLAI